MRYVFTVKEIQDGTGLTRQRVHQLIRSRKIPVVKETKHTLIKWENLIKLADNPKILDFIKQMLEDERVALGKGNVGLKVRAIGMQYAYVLLMEKELPTPEGKDLEWIKLFRKAYDYWSRVTEDYFQYHWALETRKYDYLEK